MALEYTDILDLELPFLEKLKKFLEGTGDEPSYEDYGSKGDYNFYDRGSWQGLLNRAFSDKDYANIGQSFTRRNWTDELICLDRAMLQEDCSREAYYDLEAQRVARKILKNSTDKATYLSVLSAY